MMIWASDCSIRHGLWCNVTMAPIWSLEKQTLARLIMMISSIICWLSAKLYQPINWFGIVLYGVVRLMC